jgi:hypothetical protein
MLPRYGQSRRWGLCIWSRPRTVLVEFLSAYAGRGAYLRGKALQTVRATLANVHVTVRPQTHESFMTGLAFYASRADKAYSLVP